LTELLVGEDVDSIFHRVRGHDRTIVTLRVRTLKCAFQHNENFELFERAGAACPKYLQHANLCFTVAMTMQFHGKMRIPGNDRQRWIRKFWRIDRRDSRKIPGNDICKAV
jgi:hypothetical protein